MSTELTYILGAGASFESIPVVRSFPSRFEKFTSYINGLQSDNTLMSNNSEFLKEFGMLATRLMQSIYTHQSFDTYFKKLFHTNGNPEIFWAKKILNLYFLWEHLIGLDPKPEYYDETKFWKKSIVDKRYDALIAGLLKPIKGKSETYCPVNFITWNYDLGLFLSLKNYFGPEEPIHVFYNRIKRSDSDNIWEINDMITVMNMNGFFYSSSISNYKQLPIKEVEIKNIITPKVSERYFDMNREIADAKLIKFAWESTGEKSFEKVSETAAQKIFNSKNIVVIGYTFPLYNRLVDLKYLNKNSLQRKIITVQDPKAEDLVKRIVSDFAIGLGGTKDSTIILPEMNCDNFFVPSNIYKNY